MFTRGQSVRSALLKHLYPKVYASRAEGRQLSLGIIMKIPQGKTNKDHAIYSGVVRNRDVEICPVGCLAFYLLELWMVCTPIRLNRGGLQACC